MTSTRTPLSTPTQRLKRRIKRVCGAKAHALGMIAPLGLKTEYTARLFAFQAP